MDQYPWQGDDSTQSLPKPPSFMKRIVLFLVLVFASLCFSLLLSFLSDALIPLTFVPQNNKNDSAGLIAENDMFDSYDNQICVFLSLAGEKSTLITEPITVGELLDRYGIVPDENDEINYDRSVMMFNGMELNFMKIDYAYVTVQEPIAYPTQTLEIQTIPKDYVVTVTEGVDGLSEKVIYQVIADGYVRDEYVISETVLSEPTTCVEQKGIGGVYTAEDGKKYAYSYYVDGNATAYGGPEFSGKTATGVQVEIGMIAVDPDTIPLKSEVYVECAYPGISGVYKAEDTGGAIIDNIIDIYFGMDFAPMYRFGRRNVRIYVDVVEIKD